MFYYYPEKRKIRLEYDRHHEKKTSVKHALFQQQNKNISVRANKSL